LRKPAVMLLGTGFQANLVLGSLAGIRDVIVADEYCHASLEAGLRLAYARKARFRHNDPVSLADALGGCRPEEGKLVVAEGVYSMDGDLADLPAILKLTAEQRARIYLDDAHGLGIVGRDGRGTTEYFGLEAKVDIIAGTFSKSLASSGGFVAGPASVIEYLRHGAAPFTYSAALPPAALAAAAAALDIVRTEPEHRQRLAVLTGHCRRLLREAGFAVADGVTPIVIVHPAEQKSRDLASLEVARLASVLWDEGYCVNAVLGTAASSPRWRINIMASHTEEQIEGLVRSFRDAAERVGRQLQHMGGEDVRRNA
jgi:8-amino-7-oxononanoate synthase